LISLYSSILSGWKLFSSVADYYAEMVKTDGHMEKVKSRLLEEKRKMEVAEERRKAREAKRLSKEIQSQKLKERAKHKKEDIESVKKWRKQRQQSGFADNDGDKAFDFEDGKVFERSKKKRLGVSPGDRSGGKAKQSFGKGNNSNKPKKGNLKNSKFGFGGNNGLKKQNTAETTNDFGGFSKKGAVAGNKKRKR
jgi:rRNA-processing protein EBP2